MAVLIAKSVHIFLKIASQHDIHILICITLLNISLVCLNIWFKCNKFIILKIIVYKNIIFISVIRLICDWSKKRNIKF